MCVAVISLHRQSLWNNARRVLCVKRNEKDEKRIRQSAFIGACNEKYRLLYLHSHPTDAMWRLWALDEWCVDSKFFFFASIMSSMRHTEWLFWLYSSLVTKVVYATDETTSLFKFHNGEWSQCRHINCSLFVCCVFAAIAKDCQWIWGSWRRGCDANALQLRALRTPTYSDIGVSGVWTCQSMADNINVKPQGEDRVASLQTNRFVSHQHAIPY